MKRKGLFLTVIILLAALLVKATSPGPIIFWQVRVGRYGRHFKFYKFRSMFVDAEARKAELLSQNESKDGVIFKMKDDPRITPIGKFLRASRLDELPQILNILQGDMSIVGPRPHMLKHTDEFTENSLPAPGAFSLIVLIQIVFAAVQHTIQVERTAVSHQRTNDVDDQAEEHDDEVDPDSQRQSK